MQRDLTLLRSWPAAETGQKQLVDELVISLVGFQQVLNNASFVRKDTIVDDFRTRHQQRLQCRRLVSIRNLCIPVPLEKCLHQTADVAAFGATAAARIAGSGELLDSSHRNP